MEVSDVKKLTVLEADSEARRGLQVIDLKKWEVVAWFRFVGAV